MDNSLKDQVKERLHSIYCQGQEDWLEINFSTTGSLNLTIVSNRFGSIPPRDRLEHLLDHLPVPQPALGFLSLYTPEESQHLGITQQPVIRPRTWQDLAIKAANPQNKDLSSSIKNDPHPHTVTFYSFKGGVGRTTALIHVAWILAQRGRKVVAVDLDLEAPGLSTAFTLQPEPPFGLVDYFYERAYMPDHKIRIGEIFGEVNVSDALGRLFIVPAGQLSLDYVAKIDDLRATSLTPQGETLWSVFLKDIQNHLHPDLILVDSRTGLNQWGAFSLLEAADESVIFLFPNDQNQKGINILLESLESFKPTNFHFVFSPVPAINDVGRTKIRGIWKDIFRIIDRFQDDSDKLDANEDLDELLEVDDLDSPNAPLIVSYLPTIALTDQYPVSNSPDYYQKIANRIDRPLDQESVSSLFLQNDNRWQIIESLSFPTPNAADQSSEDYIFQKTIVFNRFLDETTCLIYGRKGTGKTALYELLLNHKEKFKELSGGRLSNFCFLRGHGHSSPHSVEGRLTRADFQALDQRLQPQQTWEQIWRSYLLIQIYRQSEEIFLKKSLRNEFSKFKILKEILSKMPPTSWQSEHLNSIEQLVNQDLLVCDALSTINQKQEELGQKLCFLYDDLDEDFKQQEKLRERALVGLFQLVQFCDARQLNMFRFKIFLRQDIWSELIFENKSHFNGRHLSLEWKLIDFLRLAYRQATCSSLFKSQVQPVYPIDDPDNATENQLREALGLLWGEKRRRGSKAKYVDRWIYERLTDASGTTFPRSLSILLSEAKGQELSYRNQPSVQFPDDRFLRSRALEVGLERASSQRCDEIREEYPELSRLFDALKDFPALATREQLEEQLWQNNFSDLFPKFSQFIEHLEEIGLLELRKKTAKKEEHYRFADIYIYGFGMSYKGTK